MITGNTITVPELSIDGNLTIIASTVIVEGKLEANEVNISNTSNTNVSYMSVSGSVSFTSNSNISISDMKVSGEVSYNNNSTIAMNKKPAFFSGCAAGAIGTIVIGVLIYWVKK